MKQVHPGRPGTYETLTVAELQKFLAQFPETTPVVATWEGVTAAIREDWASFEEGYLIFDVEKYG